MKRKTAVISLAFIVFIILMAIIGPYVVPYDPQAPDYTAMMQGPSAATFGEPMNTDRTYFHV